MSSELPADVNPYQIEPQLSAYAPRPPRIDRDRLMFEAGLAAAANHPAASAALSLRPGVVAWFPPLPSAAPFHWMWPVCTAAMTVVAVSLGLVLAFQPPPRVQVVHLPTPTPQSVPDPTLAATSGGLNPSNEVYRQQPAAEEEAPVISLETLPENHLLRVRQLALTNGVDSLTPVASSRSARLSPPPTRGSLMRKLAPPPAAAAALPSSPLLRWPNWFSPPPKPAM